MAKMSSENKDLPNVTERLKESRGEMVGLEHSVANEEARLSDFKRETVRNAMGLRLGAMLELAEKMTIISELGRLLIDEVPMETTEPGGMRAPYYGPSSLLGPLFAERGGLTLPQERKRPSPSSWRLNGASARSCSTHQAAASRAARML